MTKKKIVLVIGKDNPWLASGEDNVYGSVEPIFLELHATAMLCLPSGECLLPDATVCTTLMSALYTSVSEEDVLNRQLMVKKKPTCANFLYNESSFWCGFLIVRVNIRVIRCPRNWRLHF